MKAKNIERCIYRNTDGSLFVRVPKVNSRRHKAPTLAAARLLREQLDASVAMPTPPPSAVWLVTVLLVNGATAVRPYKAAEQSTACANASKRADVQRVLKAVLSTKPRWKCRVRTTKGIEVRHYHAENVSKARGAALNASAVIAVLSVTPA